MEKIKKALEKAQEERESVFNTDNGSLATRTVLRQRGAPKTAVPDEIHYTGTQNIDVTPEFLREQRVIAGMGPCRFSDAYKVLRTKVLQRMRGNNWNLMAVTSHGQNEGKSLTAVNLAISLALQLDQTVLLVDANLKRPCLHEYFGFTPKFGLSDYLVNDVPIEKILVHPNIINRFVLLPGSKPLVNSSEMLSSPRMVQLVEELKKRYPSRLVIFDLSDLSASDPIAFAPLVDATLLVVDAGRTQQADITSALEQLKESHPLGIVLNKAY